MARVLPPIKFRFAEADREKYGDAWHVFDETELHGLRARELMILDAELRAELGLNVITSLESFLRGDNAGALAVMWLARRLSGEVDKLADFDPLPMLAEIVTVEPEVDADPPAMTSSESPAATPEE
ncbi:hypothetical protein ABZ738_05470 [Micromonospora sp. NPDC047793]|uniref:hypothetical protein n=1 Tax=Micromonospora sp. NPDC047793 TaxID=3154342 RepID=UPI0033FE3730